MLPTSMINPLLLNNLKEIYSIRQRVFNQSVDTSDININNTFDNFNNFQDGRGVSIMKHFDKLYSIDFHSKFPERQYELFNSSFLDSLSIATVCEAKLLIQELQELMSTFQKKENSIQNELTKSGRSNGPFIEIQAKKLFTNWREYLVPFVKLLEETLERLLLIPLASEFNFNVDNSDKYIIRELKENEEIILKEINKTFQSEFKSSENRINSYAQMSQFVNFSGVLNSLATVLMKIANDVRFLSSGPRSGYGELIIPENEPGSSIMPGKVNPTQCESLTMISCQVIGNHTAVSIANSSSMFESNSFKNLIASNVLRSVKLLEDGIRSFNANCAVGIELIENDKKGNF